MAHEDTAAVAATSSPSACWCCGDEYDEHQLSRLGAHPEVGVCVGCAHWLHRRARAQDENGRRTPGAIARRGITTVRSRVIDARLHERGVVGPLLRRLDRHLP